MPCSILSTGRRCPRSPDTNPRLGPAPAVVKRTSRKRRACNESPESPDRGRRRPTRRCTCDLGLHSGRREAAHEADTEQPIRAPQRVSTQNGEPVITLDIAAQRSNGITTARLTNCSPSSTLASLWNGPRSASADRPVQQFRERRAQLEASRAKLAASHTAFERAQELYKDSRTCRPRSFRRRRRRVRTDQAGLHRHSRNCTHSL